MYYNFKSLVYQRLYILRSLVWKEVYLWTERGYINILMKPKDSVVLWKKIPTLNNSIALHLC